MLGKEKRKRFAKVLTARGKANSGGAGASRPPAPEALATITPTSPAPTLSMPAPAQTTPNPPSPQTVPTPTSTLPIEAIPLAMVGTSSPPALLDKGKGVVIVPSSDKEDTAEGPVFKRRRTTTVATSHSTSNKDAEPLRDHPPSALTPPNYTALGEGAETIPEPTPAPAPELSRAIQYLLKGFQQVPPEDPSCKAMKENALRSFGEYLSVASSWRKETEAKARELALLKEQMIDQARRWFNQEAAIKEALKVAQKAEEATNKRLHVAGQTYTELVAKVVSLHEQIVELKVAEASKTKVTNLEARCASQEVNLGKVEANLTAKNEAFDLLKAELAAKNEAFDLMKADLTKQLAEKAEVLAAMEKELASQAARSQKVEKELLDDATNAFATGFEEALSQVVCEHPEMDVSNYGPTKHVVEGNVVPIEFSEDD